MWALGVWLKGQISSLIEAARANLTAAINTRATPANVTAAQTALTTTINTRATPANVTAAQTAITNHVTNHVNSRTVAGGQPQAVRSVQRGTISLNSGVTHVISIAAVNTNKAQITVSSTSNARAAINNSNSLQIIHISPQNSFSPHNISWEVIEYF